MVPRWRSMQSRLEIMTKAGMYVPYDHHPDRRFAHYNASAARLLKSAEKSLRLLGVGRIGMACGKPPKATAGA